MKILLPKACNGARILEVFAQAATFEIFPEKRWAAVETVENEGIIGKPLFVRKNAVFKKKGVDIITLTKKKRWIFFRRIFNMITIPNRSIMIFKNSIQERRIFK